MIGSANLGLSIFLDFYYNSVKSAPFVTTYGLANSYNKAFAQ